MCDYDQPIDREWMKNRILMRLSDWGADISGGMDRFLYDEALYMKCLKRFPADPAFERLDEAVKKKDSENAYEAAHTLKGASGTLNLIPFYRILSRVLKDIQGKDTAAFYLDYMKLLEQRKEYELLIAAE